MPVAEGTQVRPAPLVSSQTQGSAGALTPPPVPGIARPTGPPIPALAAYGWHGSVTDWNQRVQQVVDSYHAVHGYQPGPGLVFDVARSPVPTEQLTGLWTPGTASTNRQVKSFPSHLLAPIQTPHEPTTAGMVGGGLGNPAALEILNTNPNLTPRTRAVLAKLSTHLGLNQDESLALNQAFMSGELSGQDQINLDFGHKAALTAAGIISLHPSDWFTRTLDQIGAGFIGLPYGAYAILRAFGLDARDVGSASLHAAGLPVGARTFTPARTGGIVEQTAKQVYADITDPVGRSGYLLWDIAMLGRAPVSAAARLTGAAKIAGEEGVKAGARSLLVKPPPGRFEIADEYVNLREDVTARTLQKWWLGKQASRLASGEAGFTATAHVGPLQPLLDFFSPEATVTRAARRRVHVETMLANHPATELQYLLRKYAGAGDMQARMLAGEGLPQGFFGKRGRAAGVQKLLQVLLGDVIDRPLEDPYRALAIEQAFHESMIANAAEVSKSLGTVGKGADRRLAFTPEQIVTNHQAQLAAVSLAKQVLEDPPKAFMPIFGVTQRTSLATQYVRETVFGFPPEKAARSTASYGAVIRGEPLREPTGFLKSSPALVRARIYRDRLQKQYDMAVSERGAAEEPTSGPERDILGALRKANERVQQLEARAKAETARRPLTPLSEESVFFPRQRALYGKRGVAPPPLPARVGPYGVAPVDASRLLQGALDHEFTGDAVKIGDNRIDVGNMVIEQLRLTTRAAQIVDMADRLWKDSHEVPRPGSVHEIPIRDPASKTIADEHRAIMQRVRDGTLSKEDVRHLHDQNLDDMFHSIFPGKLDKRGKLIPGTIKEPLDDVRWIDERRLLEQPGSRAYWDRVDLAWSKWFAPLNEPVRDLIIFARPSYLWNAVGSAFMLFMSDGFAAMPNFGRALGARHFYGEEISRWLGDQMGETRTASFATERGRLLPSQYLFRMWQPITDDRFRKAAFIYRLRQQGIRTREEMQAAMEDRDPALRAKVVEAVDRANKDMVDYRNLRPIERAVLRHVFFVYGWVSRSALWAIDTMIDNPVKVGVLEQAGLQGEQEIERLIGKVPAWFAKSGFFPTGVDSNGDPVTSGLSSLTPYSTWVQLAQPLLGLGSDVTYSDIESTFGPAAQFVTTLVTGKDRNGNPVKGGTLVGAARAVLEGTPEGQAVKKIQKQGKAQPLAAPAITDREALIKRESQEARRPSFRQDTLKDVLIPAIFGAAIPRHPDRAALAAKYWREQPADVLQKHQLALINQQLRNQARLLGRPLPPEVRRAADFTKETADAVNAREKETGVHPLPYGERARVQVQVLEKMGLVTAAQAAELEKKIVGIDDKLELQDFHTAILQRYAGGKQLAEWTRQVREAAQFRSDTPKLEQSLGVLQQAGAGDWRGATVADTATRDAYGRAYLAYTEEMHARAAALHGMTPEEAQTARRENAAWEAGRDRPVTVNGVTFPSPVRMLWALHHRTPDARAKAAAILTGRDWAGLSGFEKELAGRRVPPSVAEGWAVFDHDVATAKAAWEKENPPGTRLPRSLAKQLVKYAASVGRDHPGFYQDYLFAHRPLFQRMQVLPAVTQSPARGVWEYVFSQAQKLTDAHLDGVVGAASMRAQWKRYVTDPNGLTADIAGRPAYANFLSELKLYRPTLLESLIG